MIVTGTVQHIGEREFFQVIVHCYFLLKGDALRLEQAERKAELGVQEKRELSHRQSAKKSGSLNLAESWREMWLLSAIM